MTELTHHYLNKSIGARLRIMRYNHNASQEKLAMKLDLTEKQLNDYEEGEAYIPATTLIKVLRYFGVPANIFFAGMTDMFTPVIKQSHGVNANA